MMRGLKQEKRFGPNQPLFFSYIRSKTIQEIYQKQNKSWDS